MATPPKRMELLIILRDFIVGSIVKAVQFDSLKHVTHLSLPS